MICLSPVEVERANVEPALEHLIHESIAGFSLTYNYSIFFFKKKKTLENIILWFAVVADQLLGNLQ